MGLKWDTSSYNCGGYALGTFDWIRLESLLGFGIVKCKELKKVTNRKTSRFMSNFTIMLFF